MDDVTTFKLIGGRLCLDFTNTVDTQLAEPRGEKLVSYDVLVAWARQAGAIGDADARRLVREAARRPERAAAVLRDAVELRDAMFRVFLQACRRGRVPDKDLAVVNRHLGRALSRQRLVRAGDDYVLGWDRDGDDLDAPLWPIARSAADLLASPERERVHVCSADDDRCTWLFLDVSRNQSRRWCSMRECGNRAKARRHYHRAKEAD